MKYGPLGRSGLIVSRICLGGNSWGATNALIVDADVAFNDKDAITADPTDARFVYAVWDRLSTDHLGPTYFSRSADGGATWQQARAIYDPGLTNQTISNALVVLPNGTLVTTEDGEDGSISSADIEALVDTLLG